ncbi:MULTISPECIES: endopeptidase La [Bacteroides]|jgi:ATP-dependent Lon protease|uniref:Lon protease n=1 Tax=Bacteroides fragilis TaxID=817 RepID=A0A0I9UP11_BACFG|nr:MULTISPECIES: endopeptidase La [Bacteroides]MCE8567380.1 endopeptidase La [Bacteroides fragilis]MCE8611386.1 endopeptidase La [Bacteroides fragilis]MCM0196544.1 endopeptidase La [Bacteroides fragilis]MCM0200832.1 endopeptidase La [Bacteroides fragilis]MCM0211535.1 endopeptidase La [Bacteroides fragilis]
MKKERYLREMDDQNDSAFSLIADFDGNEDQVFDIKVGETLPVLPLRNMVLFPGVFMPVSVGRKSSLRLVREADKKKSYIAVVCQKMAETDEPAFEDLHPIGTIGKIVRVLEMPDQTTTVIIQGMKRLELKNITETHPYLKGEVNIIDEEIPSKDDKEFQALVETCKDLTIRYIKSSDSLHQESAFAIKNLTNHMFLVDFICTNLPLKKDEKIELLRIDSLRERTYRLLEILNREVQLAEIKASIQMRAREDIDQQQREYFLQQQIKTIQDELGGGGQEQEIEEMRQKAEHMKWSSEVHETFLKELAKLERTHPQSPDYSVQLNYLQTMLNLPWGVYTTDNLNLKNAEKTLNKDHYGLEKVKERILEHLAVLKLKGDMKSPIICLYGPPGVGKTSLGKSIAAALKRKYIRMSLGGVHDEAEIRGHRKTYIGAMPGRIIKNLIKAGSSNPVFILDEIDKVSADRQGDPSSALLEVLDPEQNTAFHDNFLDVDYDLSKVMFIATANNLNTIPGPLLDRMELIEVSGYITEEKVEIARKHLVPKELEANGMKKTDIKIPKDTLEAIIESYTRESGVRELEKKIGKILRKSARQYATDGFFSKTEIKPADLYDFLGAPEYTRDKYQGNDYAGVVTGLAWTAVGGEILFVETSLSRGKGGRLTLTGNLGEVMKESAMLALEYIKAHASLLNLNEEIFDNWNIHVHVPEGAIPKDGPSAGITMATSLASALTQRKVKANLAMTGEITLRGKVLPVGGIKEKILAAKRAGIKEIIMSAENKKNIDEIQDIYLKGLTFHYVNDVKEVFAIALTQEKVADAIDLSVKKASQE